MSTTTTARPGGAKDGAEEAPKKSKKKLIIIAVVVVVAIAAAAWFFLLRGGGEAGEKPVVEKGVVLPVEPININLADGHYLKLGFAMQLPLEGGGHGDPDPSEALSIAIDQFSGVQMKHLSDAKHRREAIEKLNEAIVHAYEDHHVMEVYPTTFVMQ